LGRIGISKAAIAPEATRPARGRVMSEYMATEYEGTWPVPGAPCERKR